MISESIFDNGQILIPMADVSHIEYQRHPSIGANGILIITSHTRYNGEKDHWENAAYIDEKHKDSFIAAFCRYRAELEGLLNEVTPPHYQ